MSQWSAIDWLKRLTILLLVFLNGYLFYKLLPFLNQVFDFIAAVLFPFVSAALIAYLLHPLIEKAHSKGLPRTLAILIVYLVFFVLTGYGLVKGMPAMIDELKDFGDQIPKYVAFYHERINDVYHSTPEAVHDHFNGVLNLLERRMNRLVKGVIGSITWVFQSFFSLLMIPLLAFYFLKDFEGIKKGLWILTPRKWRVPGRTLLFAIDDQLGKYIRGQLYVCAILAVIAFVGLSFLKVKYALLLSIFVGLTDIIPYFGPIIGAIPAVFMATTVSVKTTIFVLVLILLLQFLEGHIIGPLIVGKSVDIHPAYIMFSIIIGGEIAGVAGMLFAVPIFVTIRVIIRYIRNRHQEIDKESGSHL
ncbi:putative PurR-regulated permease PerM [Scopulibacillus daqui]|uniref:PurR-regulated permease PerM n=1 Tax=Scopulibacillus daqui TaxID=1469162 RepID=A0ABS2Q2C7_9BACL|nr:AI-2E family transporter [Scopulibacillus daqui]MBM7645859.1 putative PurR-regulated permease PerM [Scopulibacillus daqui]